MKVMVTVGLLLVCWCVSALAQVNCQAFANRVDGSQKSIANETAASFGDNGAARQARIGNELTLIGLQIQLMAQNKCAPLKDPIGWAAYLPAALDCQTAMLRHRSSTENPKECDFKDWKKAQ